MSFYDLTNIKVEHKQLFSDVVAVVVLLFYVHSKQNLIRSCRDGQLT